MSHDRNRENRMNHACSSLRDAAKFQDAVSRSIKQYGHYPLLRMSNDDQQYKTSIALVFNEGKMRVAVIQHLHGQEKEWAGNIMTTMDEALKSRENVGRIVDQYAYLHEHPDELLFNKDFQYW